ncbi:hypothetical protein [Shewanella acanthi]|uniref:hypothetical protein n=1 Tax=Shewanella acanthi TaxID=2864212 RepID=UPI001C65A686|nr:hypothetical protein [Shewanella acanthi]QYJ79538.1 hypothetical protein K0H61_03580 [Shewanella acanthi]
MSLITFSLITSLTWVPIGDKQALICPLTELTQCLKNLSPVVRAQLPASETEITQTLGLRSAMVLPVDDSYLSGFILVNERETPGVQLANIDNVTYQLDLNDQSQLTLWHELGHLENQALQGELLPLKLDGYQHEWLADSYLIWRIAKEKGNYQLAWQQYHRRNLSVLTNEIQMSHWTSPMMIQVLTLYRPEQLASFAHYRDFIADFYPKATQLSAVLRKEYSSLIQRTFGSSVLQPLPEYLFWRKQGLGFYLKPTFEQIMGAEKAHQWLAQNAML